MARKPKETVLMDSRTEFNSIGQASPEGTSEMEAFSGLGWKVLPTLEDLKADLDYARQETDDQKSNVNGWIDLRNASGTESGRKTNPKIARVMWIEISLVQHPVLPQSYEIFHSDKCF